MAVRADVPLDELELVPLEPEVPPTPPVDMVGSSFS
jgi:hypothetical protein